MERKRELILAMAPFVIFIILGSIFIGAYYKETSLAREQIAAMDELERMGEENASWYGLCNTVDVYITVRNSEDAARLEEFLRDEKIRVAVSRDGERLISMIGRVPLKNAEEIVEKSRENGWMAAYHNNSDFCARMSSRFETENRIISAHLNELSPGSREILTEVMESNRERIGLIESEMRLWAELNIIAQAGPSYTPEGFHNLSGFLATWGVLLGVPFLMRWVFKGRQ